MKKIILLIVILLSTGCWNYRELNQLAIATGFAIDYVDDKFEVTILISNSQKENSSDSKSVASSAVYKGRGKTIAEAIKDASMAISKQIYLSHIEVLILSSEVATNKTLETIDFFFRYPQTRNEFLMAVANDCKAGDLFEITTPLETYPSQNISKNIGITDKLQAYTYAVTFNDFVKALLEEGINPVIPSIAIIGDVDEGNKDENVEKIKPDSYLKLEMMAAFNKDRFIGFTDKDQSKGINFINNKVTTTLIITDYNDGYVVIELNGSNTKVDIDIENEIPKIKIKVNSSGTIIEVDSHTLIDKEQVIDEIKTLGEEEIKRLITTSIDYAKDNETDIFGFGNMIYKKNYKYWNKIKDSWQNDLFKKSDIEIDIDLKLKTKGSIDSIIEVK